MKKIICAVIILTSVFFSNAQVSSIDSATILYFPFDGSIRDQSINKHSCKEELIATYSDDRNEFANSALSKNNYLLVNNVALGLKPQFSISFWFKAERNSNSYDQLIKMRSQINGRAVVLYVEPDNGKLRTSMVLKTGKKSQFEYVSLIKKEYKDDKWHFLLLSYDGIQLTTKVDNENPGIATAVASVIDPSWGNGSFIKIEKSFIGEWDDLSILNKPFNGKEEIALLQNRTMVKNGPKFTKFNNEWDVLKYINGRVFSFPDSSKAVAMFTENANGGSFRVNGSSTNYKLSGVRIDSKNEAVLRYYDYAPELSIRIGVNSKDSSIDIDSPVTGPFTGRLVMLPKNTKEKLTGTKDQDGWMMRGITKIEMQNPSTNSFEEILLFTPGHYIEIRDFKDLRIDDPEIFTLIAGGKEYLAFYNYAIFENGQKNKTDVPQTEAYIGSLELRNNSGTNSKKADAGLFFYYNNGKCSALEIRNKHCMCVCRIYFSDSGPGLKFY